MDKAVLLCMHLNQFPSNDDPQEGVVDVWWIVHDGGLLLLLAHLLQQHKIWRKCKLRVHTVAEKLDNSVEVKRNLEKLLEMVSPPSIFTGNNSTLFLSRSFMIDVIESQFEERLSTF